MRIGRRGWCFRRPTTKPKRSLSSSSSNKTNTNNNYYYMTKKSFIKPHYAFHVPGAPLNTTSYLIKSKGITHLCHYHHQEQQQNPIKNNEYRLSDSPVLDSYGSMKGLMGLSTSLSLLINKSEEEEEEETSGLGESNSLSKRVTERALLGSKDPNNGPSLPPPRLLSLRIMHRDDQIKNLEEESMTMKERVSCMERELDQLKHRVKVLEEEEEEVAQKAAMRTAVMIRDCCYCGDAVSVA